MKINLLLFLKILHIKDLPKITTNLIFKTPPLELYKKFLLRKKCKLSTRFLKKSIILLQPNNKLRKVKNKYSMFFFLNRFIISFLEFFFKSSVLFNIRKGTNKLALKKISLRKFSLKYFKRHLKIRKQIIGIIYYSLLLKDSSIFVNFFRKILERLNIKLHKKTLLGLRKLIKDLFRPVFYFLGVGGVFFNIKGKLGVSGNAKKRRYFFFFGRHSITSRSLKVDLKFTPVWTFTGALGFTFLIFF